jgi:hypothetical protein
MELQLWGAVPRSSGSTDIVRIGRHQTGDSPRLVLTGGQGIVALLGSGDQEQAKTGQCRKQYKQDQPEAQTVCKRRRDKPAEWPQDDIQLTGPGIDIAYLLCAAVGCEKLLL